MVRADPTFIDERGRNSDDDMSVHIDFLGVIILITDGLLILFTRFRRSSYLFGLNHSQ